MWLRHRGETWAPVPEAANKIARTRRHPTPLVHIAVKVMFGALLLGIVLFIIALASGVYDGPDSNVFADTVLHPMALCMVPPLGAYIGTFVIGAILRRR